MLCRKPSSIIQMLQVWEVVPLTVLDSHLVAHDASSATAARRSYESVVGAFVRYQSVPLVGRVDLGFMLQTLLAESRFQVGTALITELCRSLLNGCRFWVGACTS